MWISKKEYKRLKDLEDSFDATLRAYRNRYLQEKRKVEYWEEEDDKHTKTIRELYQELEEWKHKYADEVQKRLALIEQIGE